MNEPAVPRSQAYPPVLCSISLTSQDFWLLIVEIYEFFGNFRYQSLIGLISLLDT